MMTDTFHRQLAEAKEGKFRLNKAERRREQLQKRLREQERLISQLELELEAEQVDVDKLTRMSLTNLFHTILRSKEEQLEMERQQVLAAALKLQKAKQLYTDIESDLKRVGDDLANYRNAEREYEELMAEKESVLRSLPVSSTELAGMEEQITNQALLVKELHEAWRAGQRVLASLEDASGSLSKAEGWGKWDLWGGGGMISTHLKHNHIDDAKQFIHNANHQMHNFRDELADLQRSIKIEIETGGMLKMADYWFDGLIADWVVQGRIKHAHDQLLNAIGQVSAAVIQLHSEHSAADSALAGMKSKRTEWIEQMKLD
jgi:hypothetical protein